MGEKVEWQVQAAEMCRLDGVQIFGCQDVGPHTIIPALNPTTGSPACTFLRDRTSR
jgi:hypothetical protein